MHAPDPEKPKPADLPADPTPHRAASEAAAADRGPSVESVSGDDVSGTGFDGWVRSNPWHPRIAPFFCWIVFMTVGQFLPEALTPIKPFLYLAQCVATVWLLWTYRKLTPELTLRFHWLAIPTGVGLLVAWVVLGYAMAGELGWRWSQAMAGEWARACGVFPYAELGLEPGRFGPDLDAEGQAVLHPLQEQIAQTPALGWFAMGLRLLGMSLIVPLFEEMFIRSAMLRGLHRPGPTFAGLVQFASDLPGVGDWISQTAVGRKANAQPSALTAQLVETPVGHLTLFAVVASTLVFMASHQMRDWPGCIACGLVWCGLVWWTNRPRPRKSPHKGESWDTIRIRPELTGYRGGGNVGRLGLGPIAWSHGITNALLWAYTIGFGDWRYL